jgi:hypothetical protein
LVAAGEEIAGEGWSPAREWKSPETERRVEQRSLWLGFGLEAIFLKHDMGAPDSLQFLSGAHWTTHSSCPVNHRTAHRKMDFERAAAGAPDIAQCSVRCTPDCPVSPDRGKF